MRDFHLFCKIKEISFILPINEISFILPRGFEIVQNVISFFLGENAIWHCVLLNAICKYCTGKQVDTRTCADPRAVQCPRKSENNVMVSPTRILVAVLSVAALILRLGTPLGILINFKTPPQKKNIYLQNKGNFFNFTK